MPERVQWGFQCHWPKKFLEFKGDRRDPNLNKLIKPVPSSGAPPRNGTLPSSPISDPWTLRTISPASKTFNQSRIEIGKLAVHVHIKLHSIQKLSELRRFQGLASTGSIFLQSKMIMKFLHHIYTTFAPLNFKGMSAALSMKLFSSVPCWLEMLVPLCGCGYHSAQFSGQVRFASSVLRSRLFVSIATLQQS